MSTSLSNEVNSSSLSNYLGEAAITMLFGMGYYFVNKFNKQDKEKKEVLIENSLIQNEVSLQDFHKKIKDNSTQNPMEILSQMQKSKLTPTIETYNVLMINACKNGFFSEARKLKEEIFETTSPIYPNVQTFNLLLKCVQLELMSSLDGIQNLEEKENQLQIAIKKFNKEYTILLDEMENRGLKPSAETNNIYMDILLEQGRSELGLSHFEKVHKTLEFDIYTFTTALKIIRNILNNYHYNNKTKDLESFKKNNFNNNKKFNNKHQTKNDYYTIYNEKINYIRKYVEEKVNEIKEEKLKDNVIYSKGEYENYISSLIDAFISLKDHDQAKNIFKNYSPREEASYVSMIKIFTIEKNLNNALNTFLTLKKNKGLESKNPTISGYGAILNACAKLGNMKLAEEILKEMSSNSVQPNSHVYSTLINGYRLAGRLDLAIQAYNIAEQDTQNLTTAVVNTILNACAEEGEFKKVASIYESLIDSKKVKPDKITFAILIKSYSKHNEFDKLWDLYSYLIKNKIFDEITFNSLLDVFANVEHETNLYEIYNDMKINKINISVYTYGVLLKLYVNLANKERSEEIYQEILRKKLTPTIVVFQLMIKLYSYLGYPQKVWAIYQSMINNYNTTPDNQLFDSLLRINLKFSLLYNVKNLINHAFSTNSHIEKYLVESFFIKLNASEELSSKEKKNLANEISHAHNKKGIILSRRVYEIMDEIFHGSSNKYQNNSNSNSNYKNVYSYIDDDYSEFTEDKEVRNEDSPQKTNKFDIKSEKLSNYSKMRYNTLKNIYEKCYGVTKKAGTSIYDDN